MRNVLLSIGLTLAGMASPALAFEGSYRGTGAQDGREARITRQSGAFKVELDVSTPRCVGSFEGLGVLEKGHLLVQNHDPDDGCTIILRKTAGGFTLSEKACSNWHGAHCDFSGAYRKR